MKYCMFHAIYFYGQFLPLFLKVTYAIKIGCDIFYLLQVPSYGFYTMIKESACSLFNKIPDKYIGNNTDHVWIAHSTTERHCDIVGSSLFSYIIYCKSVMWGMPLVQHSVRILILIWRFCGRCSITYVMVCVCVRVCVCVFACVFRKLLLQF